MSEGCRDLLRRLLVAKPSERLSMEEIKQHPWFQKQLPDGALKMNAWYEPELLCQPVALLHHGCHGNSVLLVICSTMLEVGGFKSRILSMLL